MRHRFPFVLGAAFVASTLSLAAQAPSTTAPKAPPASKGTHAAGQKTAMTAAHHFVKTAAEGGMAEVELGKLATDKASNPKVKEFGQRMVTDHGKWNEELKSLAASQSITLPTTLNAKHQALKDRLSKLSGAAFDRAYMAEMVRDHEADYTAFRKEATTGQDPAIKAWADKIAPLIDEHLTLARETQKALNTPKATQ